MQRFENPDQSRFLTFSCYQRLPLLGHPAIRDLFVEHLAAARRELSFKLYGWVIMPEHVHLLLVPPLPEVSVSDILARIKRPLARRVIGRWRTLKAPILSKITDAEGLTRYWQKGGVRNVRRKGEITSKINYMHMNPVATPRTRWVRA